MIHYPSRRRIRASQHTQLSSSSGGIGESPLNPKLHPQKPSTNSLLQHIRHSRNRSQSFTPITSQQVDYTDHHIPPNHHTESFISTTHSTYHDPSSSKPITNQLEHSNLHSFVASLGRAPISTSQDPSIKPAQILHSRHSQPTLIIPFQYESTPWSSHTSPANQPGLLSKPLCQTHQQHSTAKFPHPVKAQQSKRPSSPRLVSTRARSNSTMDIPTSAPQVNPAFKHGHSRSASAHRAHIPSQPDSQVASNAPITPRDDSTYVRLRVLSFETIGGFYGKYADPKPRFVTTTLSRPATSLGTKRPNEMVEELAIETPCHPRKVTRSVTNPRVSQSLEALKQRAIAAAEAERTHSQRAWDEIYRLRLERELWRAEAEAACNPPSLFCTSVFPSSPADLIRRPRQSPHSRRRPSAPIHTRSGHSSTARSLPSRSFSFRNRAQSAPLPPDQPSSQSVAPNARKSSLSPFAILNPPPRRSSISQPFTVRSYLKRPSSLRSRVASRTEARVNESVVKPPSHSASSRPLEFDRALSPEVGRGHDFICCSQPRIKRGRAHSNAAHSQPEPTLAHAGPQPLKGLGRSRSVPGLRRRRPATADNILPPLPTNAPHNISAQQLNHSPSYRLPSTESEPPSHLRGAGCEAQIPSSNSWFSNRSTEAFQSFFQRLPSSRSKLQTPNIQTGVVEETSQMTDPNEHVTHAASKHMSARIGEFAKPYQGLTVPAILPFNAHSSLQSDSLCDPILAPLSGEMPDNSIAHTAPVDLGDRNLPCSTLHNSADAKLYSLPLVVPAPSESFNPLPPPPRRRNSTKNLTDSLGSKRSKSLKSGLSENAHSTPSPSGSRSTSRCRGLSFINTSPPAVPNLADTSYEAPPLTPPRPTTATNPTRPSPIIITPNVSSALVTLERIRRLSTPDPLLSGVGSESSFINPWRHSGRSSRTISLITRGPMGTGSVPRTTPSSPRSSQASPLSTQILSKNFMDSTNVTSANDGIDSPKEDDAGANSPQIPESPITENNATVSSQSISVQSPSHSGESLLGLSGSRYTRRRVRTMTELSGSSSQSESSHSLIDLDKYIDQADLFYQVPASPRRDLIKRYSEQMTDQHRTSVRRPPMSPDRRSRLIDEVLSDYFHQSASSSRKNSMVEQASQEIDEQQRPEGQDTAGLLSGVESRPQSWLDARKSKVSSSSLDREQRSTTSASATREVKSRISLAPSIVDIYEAGLSKD